MFKWKSNDCISRNYKQFNNSDLSWRLQRIVAHVSVGVTHPCTLIAFCIREELFRFLEGLLNVNEPVSDVAEGPEMGGVFDLVYDDTFP